MARLTKLSDHLDRDDQLDQADDQAPAGAGVTDAAAQLAAVPDSQDSAESGQEAPVGPRRGDAGTKPKRTRKAAQRAPRAPRKPTGAATPEEAPDEPRVRAVDTTDAKRVGLYLHPDDWRELKMAHVEDGADLNARIRAMIAIYRTNTRYRATVDRLARTAPRGGQR